MAFNESTQAREGQLKVEMNIVATLDIDGNFKSLDTFRKRYPRATITEIDGRETVEPCQGCGRPLFLDEEIYIWAGEEETVYTCLECGGAHPDHKPEKLRTA